MIRVDGRSDVRLLRDMPRGDDRAPDDAPVNERDGHEGGRRSGRPSSALLADADPGVRETLRRHLELAGFAVVEARDGRDALERLRAQPFAVVILDDALPLVDGVTLCRAVRAQSTSREAAIVLLSHRTMESDKVAGLLAGADDYLTKPVGVRELMARVAARLRRHHASPSPMRPTDRLAIDIARREVHVEGRRVDLTRQDFDVLCQLAARPGMVLTRAALLRTVWRDDDCANERTVDVAISRLRRKIERNPRAPELIVTAWGVGYKLSAPAAPGE